MKHQLQKTIDYIEENLKADLQAEELADICGYSVFHFYRLFQMATGMPVMQYVHRRRMLHAIWEMGQGGKRIDIALQYGFETYAGFYRAFQRMFQLTPTDYLKKGMAKKPYRINLFKEEAMHITHKKAKEMLKHWNMESQDVQDIYYDVTGNRNDNAYLIGDDYVLKFTVNFGKMQQNQKMAALLAQAGLSASVSVPTIDGKMHVQDGEMYFYLTRRLQGRQMNAVKMYEDNRAVYTGEIIGLLHKALEREDAPVEEKDFFDSIKNWALQKTKEIMQLDEAYCSDFIGSIQRFESKLPRQCIHRDPNPGNIIVNGDEWGFIDFELSEKNIRIFDPCYAATAVLSETYSKGMKEEWFRLYQDIIAGYDSTAHLTMEEKEALPYVVLGNQIIAVAWFSTQEKYRDLFETNVNMLHFLMSNMEKMKVK
ncbi:MAG: helix-turn-helix domain-containing protein [Clostridia bacterium]|nr:helix-turn-helix domain-containing protein [Clostridia bacterium]